MQERKPHLQLSLHVGLSILLLQVPVVVIRERGGAGEAPRCPELPQTHSRDSKQCQGPGSVDTHLPARGALDDCKARQPVISGVQRSPGEFDYHGCLYIYMVCVLGFFYYVSMHVCRHTNGRACTCG